MTNKDMHTLKHQVQLLILLLSSDAVTTAAKSDKELISQLKLSSGDAEPLTAVGEVTYDRFQMTAA